jgi:hypothetical protein
VPFAASNQVRLFTIAIMLLVALGSACSSPSEGEGSYFVNCPGALDVVIRPSIIVLNVGSTATATAEFNEPAKCAPPFPEAVGNWRWTVRRDAIVAVDSISGVVSALAIGRTYLVVRHIRHVNERDSVLVDVR